MDASTGPGSGTTGQPPVRDRAPWWRRDPRWSVPAAVTGVCLVVGAAVASAVGGVGGTLGAEAGFGAAAAFGVATGVRLRHGFLGRADDDVDTYADGIIVELEATGVVGSGPIARVTRDDGATTVATLHRHTLEPDGPPGVRTITASLADRELRLQHRHGTPDDTDTATASTDSGGEAPDLVVRWVDADDVPVAGAHRHHDEPAQRWTLPARGSTLRFETPADPQRRPARRTLVDTTTGRAFLLSHDRRGRLPVTRFAAPPELDDAAVVLCLWLCHLLDTHAAAHETWSVTSGAWALVADDFPSFLGPGGFGRTYNMPIPSSGGGGS